MEVKMQSIPNARPMNYSTPNFQGKQQMVKTLGAKTSRIRNGSISRLRLWLQTTAFLGFIGLLGGEYCSFAYTGKSLGQNAVEQVSSKRDAYKLEHGDTAEQFGVITKKMQSF